MAAWLLAVAACEYIDVTDVHGAKCMNCPQYFCLEHVMALTLQLILCMVSSWAVQEGCVHIVQEYCTTDLVKLLDACYAPVPADITKALMQQMLLGMHACHAAGTDTCKSSRPAPAAATIAKQACNCLKYVLQLSTLGTTILQ